MGSPAAVTAGGEFVKRWTRVLVPVVAIGAAGASVMPASAATAISPPTIGPVGGFYTAGTAATFTFTENGVGTAVAYQYTLNDGATQTIAAPSGTASPAIVPTRQHNRLIAYAVAADGTVSGGTVDDFFARAATPTADKDLNGDGRPDLLTVGNTAGLAPGLWQATGRPATGGSAGLVTVPATDIGVNGNGFSTVGSPADFNSAQAITGGFFGRGFQDVLVYYPSGFAGDSEVAGEGVVLAGPGDGSALNSVPQGDCTVSSGMLADFNGDNPLLVANAYASLNGSGLPDLLTVSGDAVNGYSLDYFISGGAPCLFFQAFTDSTVTPDGTADWNKWTLATLGDGSGAGMFLWNQSTGALYLWEGVTAHDNGDGTGTLSHTQYLVSPHWNRGKSLSTLEAADLNGDGVPDLWAVTSAGTVRAYLISHLSARGRAEITPRYPQNLS
jgi:hypothetical protein